ncbi:MAG: anion permease [Chloroflexi bacterium]|nr:anion permease [Chloroflexota bacterium]MEE2928721.1 inorganic phosphate transporter [Chloroflexota bacterium]HIB13201.1 inorganic phosphate transporter [Dehalococcoidia bacterium]
MIDSTSLTFLIAVILIALAFDFANGFNDAANAIATVVSTRVMSPLVAVTMAGVMNFLGALSGTAVAKAVGKGVVDPDSVTLVVVAGGVAAAAAWVFLASRMGLPVSGSHSLIAGVAGAGIAHGGTGVLVGSGIMKIVLGLAFSPLLGLTGGFAIMLTIYWVFRHVSPAMVTSVFSKLQIGTAAAMAFSHGSNDAQKTMGIITLALFVSRAYNLETFEIPFWVILLSASVMALGTYFGGSRVIRTLGVRIITMRPVHGFAAESAAATVIEVATRIGIPVSTTHVITSTILGMGSTRRISAVRWGVAKGIVYAWVLTFPICGVLGAGLYLLVNLATKS